MFFYNPVKFLIERKLILCYNVKIFSYFKEDFMNIEELLKRINFLYKKSKEQGLTDEEKEEKEILREKYLQNFRNNFRNQLESLGRSSNKKRKN